MSSKARSSRVRSLSAPCLSAVVLGSLLLLAAGCGKKGDPMPPVRAIPSAVKDLQIHQQGTDFILRFSYPKTTVSGGPLPGVNRIELLAATFPAPSPGFPAEAEPRRFAGAAEVRRLLNPADLSAASSGDRVFLRLPVPAEDNGTWAYYFGVRTLASNGEISGISNVAGMAPATPPEPPQDLAVVPGPDGLMIRWQAPEGMEEMAVAEVETSEAEETAIEVVEPSGEEGTEDSLAAENQPAAPATSFNVYRRDARSRAYNQPGRPVTAGKTEFLDTTARYGRRYIYTVTTVSQRDPVVESRLSAESEVFYQDRFAADAPTGLVALPESGQVRLRWDPSPSRDATSYHVYRREGADGDFRRLTRVSTGDRDYVDATARTGRAYAYRITALDDQGNEGEPGEEVTITVR